MQKGPALRLCVKYVLQGFVESAKDNIFVKLGQTTLGHERECSSESVGLVGKPVHD